MAGARGAGFARRGAVRGLVLRREARRAGPAVDARVPPVAPTREHALLCLQPVAGVVLADAARRGAAGVLEERRRTRSARPAVRPRVSPEAQTRGAERLRSLRMGGVGRTGGARRRARARLVLARRAGRTRPAVGPRVSRVADTAARERAAAHGARVLGTGAAGS